ncbi:MAG: ATP-dependent protease LonB [Candidatus Micrarchaeia archaeon]
MHVSEKLVDQIIGQEKAVEVIKKAARQKRNVLLIGIPGTGKSMIAQAMSELIPLQELQDIIVEANPDDENVPKIKVVKAGDARKFVAAEKTKGKMAGGNINIVLFVFMALSTMVLLYFGPGFFGEVITAALLIGSFMMGAGLMFASQLGRGRLMAEAESLKVLVDNKGRKKAPFVEATGAKAGSLLGDVRHDPFQSTIDETKLYVRRSGGMQKISFGALWKEMVKKYPDLFERREDGYEAIMLPESEELYTLGVKDGQVVATRMLVINRRPFKGKIVATYSNKGLLETTPEHAYILSDKEKKASELDADDELLILQDKQIVEEKISSKSEKDFDGWVYNTTTDTGNFFANDVLIHNSGGLGTPPHLRVEAGFVHKANKGVLFVDEVATLRQKSQQELLTAMQERKYSITGQSEMSSGAMVRTEPVPCDFVLVAAGNYTDLRKMHPALRSRIRGYGYEVYMEKSIPSNVENIKRLVQFIAQEVKKDGKIPHFDKSAVVEIIKEAHKRSGRKNKLTLKLRDLGGLIRAAGDLAKEQGAHHVSVSHVRRAKVISSTLEQQAMAQYISIRKDYQVFQTRGKAIGRVNGLAVMADAGLVLPIVAEVSPAASKLEGKIIATGKLEKIAEEAVQNVSVIIKKHLGKDTSNYDVHVQFLQTYEGVEGDSASVSVATAVISALEEAPIDQNIAMTGSLSVRGEVLPVGGVTGKVEAAIEAGLTKVLVPKANEGDIVLEEAKLKKVEIIPVCDIFDVLDHALSKSKKKKQLLGTIKEELGGSFESFSDVIKTRREK